VNIHHHPDDSTILAYAAGTSGEGFSLVLAAHMERCPRCRSRMAEAEALGGELLEEMPPVEMATGGLARVWERIATARETGSPEPRRRPAPKELPSVLAPLLDGDLDSIRWRSLVPGVRQHVIEGINSGRGSVRLLSIAPGIAIPHHTHGGGELTLVLRGSYLDEIGRFRSGDLADLDPSVHHQPVADTDEPCVCLIATDERLRFSGVFSRMLQPLIGI
jgi:putative transcriptional regulator